MGRLALVRLRVAATSRPVCLSHKRSSANGGPIAACCSCCSCSAALLSRWRPARRGQRERRLGPPLRRRCAAARVHARETCRHAAAHAATAPNRGPLCARPALSVDLSSAPAPWRAGTGQLKATLGAASEDGANLAERNTCAAWATAGGKKVRRRRRRRARVLQERSSTAWSKNERVSACARDRRRRRRRLRAGACACSSARRTAMSRRSTRTAGSCCGGHTRASKGEQLAARREAVGWGSRRRPRGAPLGRSRRLLVQPA